MHFLPWEFEYHSLLPDLFKQVLKMLSLAYKTKMFCFNKVMLRIGMRMLTKKTYDGESITAIMDLTSKKSTFDMYQVLGYKL
jgi:hypothetical protein